jgi:hypothetical protein
MTQHMPEASNLVVGMVVTIHDRPLIVEQDGDECKQWMPNVKEVSGRRFISISMYDRPFLRFICNRGVTPPLKVDVMKDLCKLRKQAATEAKVIALSPDQDADEPGSKRPRKGRRSAVADRDSDIIPGILDVTLPVWDGLDFVLQQVDTSVLFEGINTYTVWLECNDEAVNYFIARARAEDVMKSNRSRRLGDDGETHKDDDDDDDDNAVPNVEDSGD